MINWNLLEPRNLLIIAIIAIVSQMVIGPLLPSAPGSDDSE